MKVWQISRDDNTGGASRAAYRLHVALSLSGVESRMLWSLQDLHPARSWSAFGPGLSGFVVSA
jgi:hypothetical protein